MKTNLGTLQQTGIVIDEQTDETRESEIEPHTILRYYNEKTIYYTTLKLNILKTKLENN